MLQPTPIDKSKILYDAVSKDYDLGTYEEFEAKLQDPEKRKVFYNGVGKDFNLGTIEEFEAKIAPSVKKKPDPIEGPESTATDTPLVSEPEIEAGSSDGIEKTAEKSILDQGINFAKNLFKLRVAQGKDAFEHLKSGSAETLAGLAGIPNFINKIKFASTIGIGKSLGIEGVEEFERKVDAMPEAEREQLIGQLESSQNPISGALSSVGAEQQNRLTDFSEEINKKTIQYEGNIMDDITSGNIEQATARIANGIAGSAPSLVLAAAPGGLLAIGAGSASQKQESLEREGEGLDSDTILNSIVTGTAEGVFERVTAGLLKPLKGVFKGNSKMASEFSEKFVENTLKSMGMEATSEAATTIAQQLSDDFFKDKDLSITTANFWKNVADAALIGGIMGGGISVATIGANKVMDGDTKKKVSSIDEQIANLDADLEKNIDPNLKDQLRATKENLSNQKEGIVQSEYDKFKSLSKEERQKLGELEGQLDKLKTEYDAIQNNPELSEDSRKLLLAEKAKTAEELVESKTILIEPKKSKPVDAKNATTENPSNSSELKSDETTQTENTDVDGNPGPTDNIDKQQEVQSPIEPEGGKEAVKTYSVSDSKTAPKYTAEFKDGTLNIKDSKGNEPSAPTRRKIQQKYANDFDFTKGKEAKIPEDTKTDVNEIIAKESKNPAEIANLLNSVNTKEFIENQVDYKTKAIAENIGGKIDRKSYINFGDKNNIGASMAKSYFSKEGRSIDTIAQELSEDYGIEITPQDIVDHIDTYQNGANDVYKEVRDNDIRPLQEAFTKLTGLPANDRYIKMAIDQQNTKDSRYEPLDSLTDEELVNLSNEREQAFQETIEDPKADPGNEGGTTSENSSESAEGSGVREDSGPETTKGSQAKNVEDLKNRLTSITNKKEIISHLRKKIQALNNEMQLEEGRGPLFLSSSIVSIEKYIDFIKKNVIKNRTNILKKENLKDNISQKDGTEVFNFNNTHAIKKGVVLLHEINPAEVEGTSNIHVNTELGFVDGHFYSVMTLAKGYPLVSDTKIELSESNKQQLFKDIKYLEENKIDLDLSKSNNFYFDQPSGIHFIDLSRSTRKSNAAKFIEKYTTANLNEYQEYLSKSKDSLNKITPTEKSNLRKLDDFLGGLENDLKKFTDENLGIGLPIAVARTAVKAMRLAVKTAATTQEVIQAGLKAIQKSQWYKKLSVSEKAEINENTLEDMLRTTIEETNSTSPEAAKEKTNKVFKDSDNTLSPKTPFKAIKKKAIRRLIQKFTDRQFISKKLVDEAGMDGTKNLMINSHGASGKAKRLFTDAYNKIYNKLSKTDRKNLDEIIQLRRFIAIDNNRAGKDLPEIIHPGFIDGVISERSLEQYKKDLGDKKFKDLNDRADQYFKTYKKLLDDVYANGLISKETYDSLNGLDYQPRLFLQHITDYEGNVSLGRDSVEKGDTGGLSKEQINSLDEGSEGSLVTNSEWLLSTSLVGRMKAMAMNNINKKFIKEEYPKAKKHFEKLKAKDAKQLSREETRFIKYFGELDQRIIDNPTTGLNKNGNPTYKYDKAPKNFKKAYWYEKGVRKEFFIEEGLHDSWFNNLNGMIGSDYKEAISYASGSALLKGIATGNNPAFAIVNTPRDFMFNVVFSDQYSTFVPKAMLQVAKDTFKAINEIRKSGKKGTTDNLFSKYIEYGGDMSFLSTQGRLKKDTYLGKLVDKVIDPKTKDIAKGILDNVTLKKLSNYSEIMFRMALFDRTIKNELKSRKLEYIDDVETQQEKDDIYNAAVARARSLLDFNQGGTITKDLETVIPYLNTAVQGTRVAADAFAKNPAAITFRVLQTGAVVSSATAGISLMLISSLKGEEDDEKTSWEIYLEAQEGLSQYQRMQYMNIVTGRKDKEGEYEVIKIAKNQQLAPILSISDNIVNHKISDIVGKKRKSSKMVFQEVFNAFNNNISPVDLTSASGNLTRTPVTKAILTYATGYDFYRDQPLSFDIGKVEEGAEGLSSKSVEDFYKVLAKEHELSSVRLKGAVESMITTPSTNPFIGMLYGGAEAMTSDKDLNEIGKDFSKNVQKSVIKRMVSHTSQFNRSYNKNREFLEEERSKALKEDIRNIEVKKLAKEFMAGTVDMNGLKDRIKSMDLDKKETKKLINRIKDSKRLSKIVDRNILDIKFEDNAKVRALMIWNRYGDITDGSEDSKNVVRQMKLAKGILTDAVKKEYIQIKEDLEKN